jgi:hypothetical protein
MWHVEMASAAPHVPSDVADLIRRGRQALAGRRYVEARDLFDEALRLAPDDPQVQSLAVTAEFWRRLARDGDGFPAVTDRERGPRGG